MPPTLPEKHLCRATLIFLRKVGWGEEAEVFVDIYVCIYMYTYIYIYIYIYARLRRHYIYRYIISSFNLAPELFVNYRFAAHCLPQCSQLAKGNIPQVQALRLRQKNAYNVKSQTRVRGTRLMPFPMDWFHLKTKET